MRVRIMTWLPAAIGFFALSAFADDAAAQCGPVCPPPPPPCCEPPPPPPPPPPCCQPPAPPPCCGAGGGVNVNVNVINNAGAVANASSRGSAAANARTSSGWMSQGGGGSAYVTVEQPYPTAINGLNVEGGWRQKIVRVPYEAWRRIEKRVVIRAVCIDDRNVPHPASQVRPGRDVDLDYEGELYRCLAGTSLQYTWAEYLDEVNFDHGETMTCRKGEALWYGRRRFEGRDGSEGGFGPGLECRPQKEERDCNERSLLRRYGAGVKVLTMIREEMYTEYREEVTEESASVVSGATMVLDGGVGGRVF